MIGAMTLPGCQLSAVMKKNQLKRCDEKKPARM
jgi:hypothetical protein